MEPVSDATALAPQEQQSGSEKVVGRRRLLKALIVSGGVVALTGVPSKWVKPAVEAGELSAHAQASPGPAPTALLISDLQIWFADGTSASAPSSIVFMGEMNYKDPQALITKANSQVKVWALCNTTIPLSSSVNFVSPEKKTSGHVGFTFAGFYCGMGPTQVNVQLLSNGRSSNTLTGTLPEM